MISVFPAPFFVKNFNCFAIDLRGCGNSTHQDEYSYREFSSDIIDLCKNEKLAVLWATHLIDEIDRGENVVIINKGKVLESGEVVSITKKTKTKNIRDAFNKLVEI